MSKSKNTKETSPIMPGFYNDISHYEYNNMSPNIIRNSYLSDMEYCPAKARAGIKKDTPTLLRGRAAHSFILEGEDAFEKEFTVVPTCNRNTKKGKSIYANHIIDNLSKTPLPEEDYVKIMGMNIAVRAHPTASELLDSGINEQTIIWKDKETGILCRCRIDRIPDCNTPMIVDLKGTLDASDVGFDRSIEKYSYYRQGAYYLEGITQATGIKYEAFALVYCEWEFPHRTGVTFIDREYLGDGRDEFHQLLRLEKECRDNNRWPHYQDAGARDTFRPSWRNYR